MFFLQILHFFFKFADQNIWKIKKKKTRKRCNTQQNIVFFVIFQFF